LQVVVNKGIEGWEEVEKNSHIGCSFMFQGDVVESQGKGQAVEIKATRATLFGACDPTLYPLSKGRLPLEHLRNFAHVRPRTNTIGAVARVRSCLATAVHEFFQQKVLKLLPALNLPCDFVRQCGAVYVHAPILTSEDCEGAGEQFRVSTLTHPLPLKDGQARCPSFCFFFSRQLCRCCRWITVKTFLARA
jgi:asparaginyl-tRNA synthetase